MISVKPDNWKISEFLGLITIYFILLVNAIVFNDNIVAVISAFFGITYTMLAGKGNPKCYLFGLAGSGLYSWLSMINGLWGNLCLYLIYYIPMQTVGFFKWNQHLKENKKEIIKSALKPRESIVLLMISAVLIILCALILYVTHGKSPIIDGITTVLSITGMYLTVRRCIEQWVVWIIVNGLSAIMWINIAIQGEKVYSTVVMWLVYFFLAVYFYKEWKIER